MVTDLAGADDRAHMAHELSQSWMAASSAARVLGWLLPPGHQVDGPKLRRWARDGRLADFELEVEEVGGQWWVSTTSILAYGRRRIADLERTLAEIEELREGALPQ